MIVFIHTTGHSYTHKPVVDAEKPTRVEVVTYETLLAAKTVPRATYVFTDMDRLSLWQLRLAALTFRRMREHGIRALNDPARVLSRWGLLRSLRVAGINDFDAYRVEESARPRRWPVFLRAEGAHLGPISGLLNDWGQVVAEVERAVAKGAPLTGLLIVEYAAEPVLPGLFRKFASFRMGPTGLAHVCVHDDQWVAKTGKMGIAPPELYDEELCVMRENPYGPRLERVFDLAGVDYGRIDFGLVQGKVQVYEINTNPEVIFGDQHPSPIRQESYRIFQRNYLAALPAIDTPDSDQTVGIGGDG
jgi:hypothetical protein